MRVYLTQTLPLQQTYLCCYSPSPAAGAFADLQIEGSEVSFSNPDTRLETSTESQQEMHWVPHLSDLIPACPAPCPSCPCAWQCRWRLYLEPQSSWAMNHYKPWVHQQRQVSLTDCFLMLFGILSQLHRKLITKPCLCYLADICGSLQWQAEARWRVTADEDPPRWQGPSCRPGTVFVEMKAGASWAAPGYPRSSLAVAHLTRSTGHK